MKNFRNRMKALSLGLLIGFSGFALAATFNMFSPATGILKGNSSTYVTTAANATDLLTVIGTVPVANGGTNLTTATDDNALVGNGTTWQSKALPSCADTAGNHLNYDTSANTYSCGTTAAPQTSFAQNAQATNYTFVLGDAGKLVSSNGGNRTYTIPTNASVAYAVGTFILVGNFAGDTSTITLTPSGGVTLYLGGTNTTAGSRTIASLSTCWLYKIGTNVWVIMGPGVV